MANHCDASDDGLNRCGSASHCVIRPTKGGGDRSLCGDHQRKLARGHTVITRHGYQFFLPKASRVRARIMRGG